VKRAADISEGLHQRVSAISRITVVTLILSLVSGVCALLVMYADIAPSVRLPILSSLIIALIVVGISLMLHKLSGEPRSGGFLVGSGADNVSRELTEFINLTSALIGIIELTESSIKHIFDNPAASRFFALQPKVTCDSELITAEPRLVDEVFREYCIESKARKAPVQFEYGMVQGTQHSWYTATVAPEQRTDSDPVQFTYLVEDITLAKANEIAHIESRERLAAALEAGSLGTWDWDIQRDIVFGDSILVQLYGVPSEYLRGAPAHKFLEHIHPEDRERVRKALNTTLENRLVYHEQYRVLDPNGKVHWVSATGRVISNSEGKPIRFPGVAIDITRLKEVEAELQSTTMAWKNQLQELESVYAYAPVGLGVIDGERRWVRVNNVMAEYFGRPCADFIGRKVHEVLPTVADGFERHLADSIQTRSPVLNVDVSGECPVNPGSIGTWRTNFYPLINGNGEIMGVNVVSKDISEDQRAMEEHRAHRVILDMVTLQKPLEVVLNILTDSIQKIFPGAISYILRDHEGARLVTPVTQEASSITESIFTPAMTPTELAPITDVITTRTELLIPDLERRSDVGFLERARKVGMRSCWMKPIVLSDGEVWGVSVIHHPTIRLNPIQRERDHLDVLVRLATTVIERKAFLDRLTSTTERLQYAERAGKIGVFDWNPQTGRVVWTPQLEESYGVAPGTFEGNYEGWRKRVYPDDRAAVTDHLARLMATGQKHFNHEYRIVHSSGEVRWTSDQGELSYSEDGIATRVVGVAIDVTERKRIEDQGRRDQERLKLALEGGNLGFWDWNIVTGAVQFGGNWASMLGYSAEEVEPHVRSWETLIHPDDKAEVERRLSKHLAGQSAVYEVEHRLRTKSGQWIWILDRGRVVERDADGRAIRAVGIHADIHEQRMIREKLNSEAKRKDEFIATLAHELRNPLAPLRTGLEILRRDPATQSAVQTREMMNRQLKHMVRLIDDLLDVSRISLGRLKLRLQQVTLRSIIESALEHSRPALDAVQHTLSVELPQEDVTLSVDAARLSQVVSNLLINAAKYTPVGGKITLATSADDDQVVIRVIDSGMGIPAEKLSEIFEMFSQIVSPLDRTQGGLGIGLALVRKLVQMHGGEVYAESAGLGLGSTFTVKIPRKASFAQSIRTDDTAGQVAANM